MENTIQTLLDKNTEENMLKQVKEFEVKDSDIFLLGYPRSGTTWAQEMIWLIVNNFDYEGAKAFINERVPVIELNGYECFSLVQEEPECQQNFTKFLKEMKDPRCIKTHLKWEYLPIEILNKTRKPKIIYLVRNPKDVCLSAYYFLKYVLNYVDCSFEEYSDYFLSGNFYLHDPFGNYWNNILYFWERRNNFNILFIKYEDMKHNLVNVIRNVAEFLEKNITEEEELHLAKWLDFKAMKNNAAVNHENLYQTTGFMRVGKDGEHKKAMTANIIKKFDSWIEENIKDSDYVL